MDPEIQRYPNRLFKDTSAITNSNKISIRGSMSNILDIGRREETVRNYLLESIKKEEHKKNSIDCTLEETRSSRDKFIV